MNEKKHYQTPQMKAYQMKPQSIISTSETISTTEELTETDFTW